MVGCIWFISSKNAWSCVIDIYEAGFKNDKLPLLFKMNQSAQVAVRTSAGMTKRETITNIIRQGTVWGSLLCAATTDKLAKRVYNEGELLYKNKGEVDVPPMEMVDDILTLQKCGSASEAMNAEVNAFIRIEEINPWAQKVHKSPWWPEV